MATPLRLLILEDRASDAELMLLELRRAGFEPDWERVDTKEEFLPHLDPGLDVILADYRMPQFDAPRALRLIQERDLDIPFIVVSGTIGEDMAVSIMREGATDYLLKDRLARLGQAVTRALEQKQLRLEKQRTQEELRKALGDAKRSNEELEQFAYIASHDLQEPLRQVVSYLQLIELRYKGKLDAEADEFIGFAVQGALRMQRMIEDLLTYSRAGARDTPRAATDLEQVFNHVLAEFKQSIEASGATVTWDALPKVNAEQMVMGRLFRYLVGNALKFKGDEPPEIHIGAERTEKEWQFSVRDNGIGIDPIYFDRIFSIFDRLHTNQEYPGTGIGLALCKRIVQGYGGRIWVDSEPGAGSTFSFTIPDRDLGQGKRGASSVHPGGREQAPRSVLQGRASN